MAVYQLLHDKTQATLPVSCHATVDTYTNKFIPLLLPVHRYLESSILSLDTENEVTRTHMHHVLDILSQQLTEVSPQSLLCELFQVILHLISSASLRRRCWPKQ